MKLNKNYEYAILLGLYLIRSGRSNLNTISANLNLSLSFLEQVSRKMRKSGILKAYRGPGGGYEVVGSPTIGDVMRSVGKTSIVSNAREMVLGSSEAVEERSYLHVLLGLDKAINSFLKLKLDSIGNIVVQSELRTLDSVNENSMVN